MQKLTIVLEIEDDEYVDLMNHDLIQGDLHEFLFAELCQNWGMGMLTQITVENIDD